MTPHEQATAAHEGKVKVADLKGAAKYLYKSLTRDQLKEYAGGPEVKEHPVKKGNLYPTRVRKATSL